MFEQFTQDARDAVIDAQQVARQLGSHAIDGRHVLVGLVERPGSARSALQAVGVDCGPLAAVVRGQLSRGGLDADALASLGIDLDAVRRRADEVFGRGALDRPRSRSPRGHIPFTTDAKKALELALREAVAAQSRSIHGGHLLLGIARVDGSPAALLLSRALADADSDLAALRAAVTEPEARAS